MRRLLTVLAVATAALLLGPRPALAASDPPPIACPGGVCLPGAPQPLSGP